MATRGSESVSRPPSHEVELNQSSPRESAPPPGNQEKTTHLRFLLSDDETGFIIGNGAATVRNIRSQSRAHVLLSRQNEYYYPGTEGRIVMVLGIIDKILVAVDLVFSKLLDKIYSGAADQVTDITLIVPDACCGGIIGTDGDIIKSLIDVSGADIRVCRKDMNYPDLRDRLVRVTGTYKKQMCAIKLILQELEKDRYYNQQSANPVFPYEDSGIGGMDPINVRPNRVVSANVQQQEDSTSSVIIGVADKHVGLLIGNGGWCIKKIREHSGAKITISGRGYFISGTSNRKVTVTGSESAINSAMSMILEKVPSADVYQSER